MGKLDDKVALVMGGGADGPAGKGEDLPIGNGRAAAIQIAAEGARVVVADLSPELAQATADEIAKRGGAAIAVACDVSDEAGIEAAVQAAIDTYGSLQLLVNNVGITDFTGVKDTPVDQFDQIQRVNVRGQLLAIRHAAPHIEAAGGGAVVNVSSINALRAGQGIGYETSKAALYGLTRSAALSLAPGGVRVNAVLPGIIDSALLRRFLGDQEIDFATRVPLGRVGTPWDVAKAIVFLLSDDAAYITGTELVVDGGVTVPL